jgi:hypothetical protein
MFLNTVYVDQALACRISCQIYTSFAGDDEILHIGKGVDDDDHLEAYLLS